MRKLLILAAVSMVNAAAVENLYCEIRGVTGGAAASSIAEGVVYGAAADLSGAFSGYTVVVCVDGQNLNCGTPITANLSVPNNAGSYAGVQWNYTVPGGTIAKNGSRHQLYAYAVSQSSFGNVPCVGGGAGAGTTTPFKWTNGSLDSSFDVNRESAPARGITSTNLAILANSSDAYGIGSGGSTVCASGTTATGSAVIKSDGVVGKYILKRAIDCGNVYLVALTVTQDLSEATFTSALSSTLQTIATATTGTGAKKFQAIAIGWALPSRVVPTTIGANYSNSISSAVSLRAVLVPNAVTAPGGLALTDAAASNPMFNSPTKAPNTDLGFLPSVQLLGATCSGCSSGIGTWTADATTYGAQLDRDFAGDLGGTTGNVYWAYTSDYSRNKFAFDAASVLVGTIATGLTASVLGNSSSPTGTTISQTSIMIYAGGSAGIAASGATYLPGSLCFALTSSAGILGASQAPLAWWLNNNGTAAGCTISYGTVSEPLAHLEKFPDVQSYALRIRDGETVLEAAWKSVRQTFQGNFAAADPLMAAFPAPAVTSPRITGARVAGTRFIGQ